MKNRNDCFEKRKPLLAMEPLSDLRDLIKRTRELYGNKKLFSESVRNRDVSYSAYDVYDDVTALGTALLEIGLSGKNIALIGENSYNWIISYFAVICGVGVIVPLDKELTREDIGKLLQKSDAEAVFCSSSYKSDVVSHLSSLPLLKTVIVLDSTDPGEGLLSMPKLVEKGKLLLSNGDRSYIDTKIDREKCAAILFTSGTTGLNKGVMLSHKNICANLDSIIKVIPIESTSLSVLPFNHSFEFNCHIMGAMYLGLHVYICSSLKRTIQDMNRVQPGMTVVVPMFLEMIYNTVWREARKRNVDDTLTKAIKHSNRLLKLGVDMRPFIFEGVRNVLGGYLSLAICGGAPIAPEIISGLHDIGIDVINGYGITECSPLVTVNTETDKSPDSVGKPVYGVSVSIDSPDANGCGEILVKGDNVMLGYYGDDEATKASFADGWFKTGDYGRFDENGGLVLTGRMKNLIILENGKNVQPEEIENKVLSTLSYVKEVVVYEASKQVNGKKRKLIAAMLHVELDEKMSKMTHEELEKCVTADIRLVNRQLPTYKQIQSVVVTNDDFSKTTTMKVIRHEVIEEYKNEDNIMI